MKALVLTDHWKANLSKGDYTTDYPLKVLQRAEESGYVIILDEDEKPTMDNTKKEIEQYLDRQEIEYSEYKTKSELLDLIK